MTEAGHICPLDDLGALRIQGADALPFLQGQLSNDIEQLRTEAVLRAGVHSPQGRTLALLALIAGEGEGVLALAPLELLPMLQTQLRRYVLRAKVSISDASQDYRIFGLTEGAQAAAPTRAYAPHAGGRRLLLQPRAASAPAGPALARARWRALDIEAGLAQVYAATSGQFVAQMLNLDCIDAVSFSKGCYTGQEVIARAHFRGRVKRRMQRFVSQGPVALAPGDAGELEDGRGYRVVEAVAREDGRCEFLAVAHLPAPGAEAATRPAAQRLACTPLPLPYALPD